MDPILISVAAFVAVVALVGGVAFVMRDFSSTEVEDRLQVMTGRKARDGADAITRDDLLKEGISGISGMFGGMADRLRNLTLLFEQADSPVKPETFFGIRLASAAVGIGLGWIGRAAAPLFPVFPLMFGFMTPASLVVIAIYSRVRDIRPSEQRGHDRPVQARRPPHSA